jgi:DNA helicase MCM8
MFLLYIEANSVSNSKGQKTKLEDGCKHGTLMEFSLKDLYAIQEIQAEENLFKLIVKYVSSSLKFCHISACLGVK